MSFYKLVESHFAESNPKFNIKKYMEEYHNYKGLDEIDIRNLLPGADLVAEKTDYNVVYHGRECAAKRKSLYAYKKVFIIFSFDTDGDDCNVLSIDGQFGSLKKLYESCIKIISSKSFDWQTFLGKDESDLNFLMCFLKNYFGDDIGRKKLNKYVNSRYDNSSSETD